jgi:virginiamycin B lyase
MGILISLLIFLLVPANAMATEERDTVAIKEWPVPWAAGRPRDPYVAPDKSVWFVGQKTDYIARFEPTTGTFTRHQLKAGTGPHNLIVGADGIVWYAGNRGGYIGRHDPKTGITEQIQMPGAQARDPHTLVFDAGERHIWFTVQWGNFVGRLRLSDSAIDLIAVPIPDARPYGIIVAPNGRPWVALLGTNKLAAIDPATLALRLYTLPNEDAAPRRLVATRDGQIYYVDYSRGYLGHLDPDTEATREWAAPSGASSGPYAMAVDHMDRIWFVETGDTPNHLVGFSTRTEAYVSVTPIPSGAGSVRHMYFDARSQAIWFGTDFNTIGRATLPAS